MVNRALSPIHLCAALLASIALACSGSAAAQINDGPALSPVVRTLLDDPHTDAARRRQLLIFHGQWDRLADATPVEQAAIALQCWDLKHPALKSEEADPLTRAEAALRRGEPHAVLAMLSDEDVSRHARWLRAQAMLLLDQRDGAVAVLTGIVRDHQADGDSAADRTFAGEALAELVRLGERPPSDLRQVMAMLASAQLQLDRLYHPALLAQARLLIERHNRVEAVDALREALALNPRSSEAWYLLGRLYAQGFDFEGAGRCGHRLRDIHPQHPLAAALAGHIFLTQKDARGAFDALTSALSRLPMQPELLACVFAAAALLDDADTLAECRDTLARALPGDVEPLRQAGRYLLLARHYDRAESMLREAIDRQPADAGARSDLGLLLMDVGRETEARAALEAALVRDPFHIRAANHLALVEQLLTWPRIETPHFVITHAPGVHAVLAGDIARFCEAGHDRVTAAFGHTPPQRTHIQVLPDQSSFAVRIVGLPDIWTVAASTGPVIALSPPRFAADQRGPFDVRRVLEHEYVHTVTLDATDYRIAHWLTEGMAVWQEHAPRDFETCQLLAAALHQDALIELDRLNWAFVRPRSPHERPLAYAQSHWIIEYLVDRFGLDVLPRLLEAARAAPDDAAMLTMATNLPADTLLADFREWATQQAAVWGLDPESQGRLAALRQAAQRAVDDQDIPAARAALAAYRDTCPVDPWPHRMTLRLPAEQVAAEDRLAAMRFIADRTLDDAGPAASLAQQHRQDGDMEAAAETIAMAVSIEPYKPALREQAAAIALQHNDRDLALDHILAMTLLEPDHAHHFVRLAALRALRDEPEQAADAARRARQLDPAAPVQRFLPPDEPR